MQGFLGAEAELALLQLFPLLFRELTFNDKYWICKENELLQLILYFRLRLSILNIFQKSLIKIEQNKLTKVEATCCSSLTLSSVGVDCTAGCLLVVALDLT